MTADPGAATPPEPKRVTLDTTVVPLGERSLRLILDYVVEVGDEAETTYLEVKSELDLGSKNKVGVAKIAKFLLGAANRRPAVAAAHFRGYAVLVIGARKDAIPGVPRGVEAHELDDRLQPYLGPQFPPFDLGRITVDADREVLFIVAQPPQDGQTIFVCHKNFQGEDRNDNLDAGAIYVRGASNTRPARPGEVQALVERARGGGKPPIKLDVEVLGSIGRVDRVEEVMEQLYELTEQDFIKRQEATPSAFSFEPPMTRVFGGPTYLSAEDRAERLDYWKKRKPEHIVKGRPHFLGVALPGTGLRVLSRDRFVTKPHLTVTFHGCEVLDHLDTDDADLDKVVEPVVRNEPPYGLGFDPAALRLTPRGYPVAWSNRGEDAEVTLTPESFRPNAPWTSDQDDYVIVVRDPQRSSVTVSWLLTEDGSDEVTQGEFDVPVADVVDAADLLGAAFLQDE